MLILTRGAGETIMIGNDIAVTILSVSGQVIRIGVNAPKDITVRQASGEYAMLRMPAGNATDKTPRR